MNKANQNRVLNGDLNDDSKVSLVLPLDGNLSEKDKVYQQYFSTSPIGQRRFLVLTDAGIKNLGEFLTSVLGLRGQHGFPLSGVRTVLSLYNVETCR